MMKEEKKNIVWKGRSGVAREPDFTLGQHAGAVDGTVPTQTHRASEDKEAGIKYIHKCNICLVEPVRSLTIPA